MNPKDFYDNLLGTLPLQRGTGGTLSIKDVGLILGACLGLKNDNLIKFTENNNNYNGNSLSVKDEISLAVIKFCGWNERISTIHAVTFCEFLCVLCPYRMLQKKLQVRENAQNIKFFNFSIFQFFNFTILQVFNISSNFLLI